MSFERVDSRLRLHDNVRFVEFLGLPGAGKTTIANCLAREFSRRGVPVTVNPYLPRVETSFASRQLSRLSLILSQMARPQFIRACSCIVRLVARSRQDSLRDAVRVIWNLWTVCAAINRQRTKANSISVLDQGMLQGIWSVMLTSSRKPSPQAWIEVLSAVGTGDFVFVSLDTDPRVARHRLFLRGDNASRLQREKKKFGDGRWSQAALIRSSIESELRADRQLGREASTLIAVRVTDTATPDEIAGQILDCLTRRTPPRIESRTVKG